MVTAGMLQACRLSAQELILSELIPPDPLGKLLFKCKQAVHLVFGHLYNVNKF